jgi:DNA-binding transcriptional LysR family regulator
MEFKNLYSNVNIEILENTTEKTLESIQKNSIDIGLICRYGDMLKDMENLDFNAIHEGKMKVYVNSDSPFAAKKQITPDEILQQKVILYNGDYIRWFINNFQYHLGKLNIVFTSNHTGEILRSISNGVAISFAPDFSIRNSPFLLEGRIVEVDIINYEPIDVTLGLVRSKKKRISNVENTFFQFLESKMSDYFR